jgi:hypothetical protein
MRWLIFAIVSVLLLSDAWIWGATVRECRRVHPLWYCVVTD